VKHHGFNAEAKAAQKVSHHLLAAVILRCDGGAANQVFGQGEYV